MERFDKELEQIKIKRLVGGGQHRAHQHASREDVINMTIERERQEFESCGLGKKFEMIFIFIKMYECVLDVIRNLMKYYKITIVH